MVDPPQAPKVDIAIAGLVARARSRPDKVAILDGSGTTTFGQLVDRSERVARALLGDGDDLDERRIAYLVSPSSLWAVAQWGISRAGGICVPLLGSLPDAEIEYILDDSGADFIVADSASSARIAELAESRGLSFGIVEEMMEGGSRSFDSNLPELTPGRGCLILYTSGSTGKPKGVVWTHRSLMTQVDILIKAWGWSSDDVSLLILPLHHVHGVVNVLTCSLWAGAICRIPPSSDAETVWNEIVEAEISVFMAVPTIYHRLIASWDAAPASEQQARSDAVQQMRLMISGSAALPLKVLDRWREISGHTLLERYGMTELGMVLSNPLLGDRVAGAVGHPLPTVMTRVVDDDGARLEAPAAGHLQVRGPSVFREYWGRPDQTTAAFDGKWFVTGDVVSVDEHGIYRILGRNSVDIIKTGGEKVSALEIEDILREHEAISECAVVGIPDPEWGERVAVAIVASPGAELGLEDLRDWARSRMAPFKMPTLLRVVDSLPRTAMGKVVKPELVSAFEESAPSRPRTPKEST
jgi:malonyl-CoA/methylmalonyl-CoA synthetase